MLAPSVSLSFSDPRTELASVRPPNHNNRAYGDAAAARLFGRLFAKPLRGAVDIAKTEDVHADDVFETLRGDASCHDAELLARIAVKGELDGLKSHIAQHLR